MRKTIVILILSCFPMISKAAFGVFGSAVYLEKNGTSEFYNCFGSNIGSQPFSGSLGVFVQNAATLKIQGAELKTWKDGNGNVCSGTLYYRTFLSSNGPSGAFAPVSLPFYCNCVSNSFPCGGGACSGNDQKWQKPGSGSVANFDLTIGAPGLYTLEVYYDINGNANGTTDCPNTQSDNNGGFNYTATYIIQNSLAVDLVDFSAKAVGLWNEIIWETNAAKSQTTYVLERSDNAVNWNPLISVVGQQRQSQIYWDKFPSIQTYYRLKSRTLDGTTHYSKIIHVANNHSKIDIFPNPTPHEIQIRGVEEPTNTVILILDLLGNTVLECPFLEILDVTDISSGTYILKIINYQNITSFTSRFTRI